MIEYIAFCDIQGTVERVVRSIPANILPEDGNVNELFRDEKVLSQVLNNEDKSDVSKQFYLSKQNTKVSVIARTKGSRMLFILYKLDSDDQVKELLQTVLMLTDEFNSIQNESYGDGYYALERTNNQLINYQRELAKANERLKKLLDETRESKCTIEILERDSLTGLYTQSAFIEKGDKRIKRNQDKEYDIIATNIERFRMLNDAFGSGEGNKLLVQFMRCLISIPFDGEVLFSRSQADKFFLLVERTDRNRTIIRDAIDLLANNYPLPMRIQIDIGIYPISDRTMSFDRMCDRALLAVNSIVGLYEKNYAFYDETMREKELREQTILDNMTSALARGEFEVFLQPKVEIKTGRLIGVEALVRWNHPVFGMMSPNDFIPLFERNGFIYSLDIFVWRKACQYLREWKMKGYNCVPISVNVSRTDIYHSDLPDILFNAITENNLTPDELHLEITETAYTTNSKQLLEVINILKDKGFIIEMDDFGTGYSSLYILAELPVDVLKMDLKFLWVQKNEIRRKQVIQFIINLASELGLEVIAEGAETQDQIDLLNLMGCRYTQGYYYDKPKSEPEFTKKWLL